MEKREVNGPAMLQDCGAAQKVYSRLDAGKLNCKINIWAALLLFLLFSRSVMSDSL